MKLRIVDTRILLFVCCCMCLFSCNKRLVLTDAEINSCIPSLSYLDGWMGADSTLVIRDEVVWEEFQAAINRRLRNANLDSCRFIDIDFEKEALVGTMLKVFGASDGFVDPSASYIQRENRIDVTFRTGIEKEGPTFVLLVPFFVLKVLPSKDCSINVIRI